MGQRCEKGAEAAREAVEKRVAVLRDQGAPVAAEDMDGIHDMRVASRRLRAALDAYAAFFAKDIRKPFEAGVRKATKALGRPRELDVMIDMLERRRPDTEGRERVALDCALRRLGERRRAVAGGCAEVAREFSSAEFETRLADLYESCAPAKTCYLETMTKSLRKKHKRLHKRYKDWRESGKEEDLHAVRVAFKKFRYACEVYMPEYGGDMKSFLKELKKVQQVLGDWNDCRMLRTELRDVAGTAPPMSADEIARLAEAFDRQGAELLECFSELARPFFRKSRRQEVRRFLKSPQSTCCEG